MSVPMDIVSVAHTDKAWDQMFSMFRAVFDHHPDVKVIPVDNRAQNRGFAAGCNYGALLGDAPIIGFLNPDTVVDGPFVDEVVRALADPNVVITGNRFGKPRLHLDRWGVKDWVCGATFFVRRDFFEEQEGFDEQFWLYFEETDLIRRAEQQAGRLVRSQELALRHESPIDDDPQVAVLKRYWYDESRRRYAAKWCVSSWLTL